jgi:hypothetical protein
MSGVAEIRIPGVEANTDALDDIAKALQRIAYAMEMQRGPAATQRPCCGAYVSKRAEERSCPVCGSASG